MTGTSQERECILVIEDVEENRLTLAAMLGKADYEVVLAADGYEGLHELEDRNIDLVLLDVMLPGIDGFEVLRRIRQLFSSSELPIIMLTSRDEAEDVISALRLGANDYCIKPAEGEVLLGRVEKHLALCRGRDRVIGGYRILSKLGAGGMGVVYVAEPVKGGERVALKVLPRSLTLDDTFVTRFQRECELASRVRHPNLVPVIEAGQDDETHFMAMELVEGRTLTQVVEEAPLPVPRALMFARQIGAGLAALGEAGILHRDIKPDNILVTLDGVARITDFGIAREVSGDDRLTTVGVGLGFAPYVSPEQMMGDGDHRSDVYSLGCVLYFMLAGKDPYEHGEVASQVLSDKLSTPPDLKSASSTVPEPVARLVGRMMQPKPTRRFQTFQDLDQALASCLGERPTGLGLIRQLVALFLVAAGVAAAGWLVWLLLTAG
jgi:DNA-binding response OmpR family regulator